MKKPPANIKVTTLHILKFVVFFLFCSIFISTDEPIKFIPVPIESIEIENESTQEKLDTISIFFIGDIMQHMPLVYAAWNSTSKSYNYTSYFQFMVPIWEKMDYVVANLETTLADENFSGYPHFASPKNVAEALYKAGVNVMVTANNHCCDRGFDGIFQTLSTLDSLGVAHTGTFCKEERTPVIIKKGHFKIAIFSYTQYVNGLAIPDGTAVNMLDTTHIKEDIIQAYEQGVTHIITYLHWGNEYERTPSIEQKQISNWLIQQGVFAIIGSHPHVVQPIELTNDSLGNIQNITVFSLGNFVSNQRKRYTDGGIGVCLTLSEQPLSSNLIIPQKKKTYQYSLEWQSNWVWKPILEGKRQYFVIPENSIQNVIDSSYCLDIQSSTRFFSDTDSIIGKSLKKLNH